MANEVRFIDNSLQVKRALEGAIEAYLNEAGGELVSQTKRNTPVDTGQLKGSWDYVVDMSKNKCTVGSPLENAIWTELGTGEFALNGDGRKGGWAYKDAKGKWHKTKGKKPSRPLHKAFTASKSALKRRAAEVLKAKMK
jgi:hypothetical protein